MIGSMAEERVGAPDMKSPWEKTSIEGGRRPARQRPPVRPNPEEEDATLHPKATNMTGIEAEGRAEG